MTSGAAGVDLESCPPEKEKKSSVTRNIRGIAAPHQRCPRQAEVQNEGQRCPEAPAPTALPARFQDSRYPPDIHLPSRRNTTVPHSEIKCVKMREGTPCSCHRACHEANTPVLVLDKKQPRLPDGLAALNRAAEFSSYSSRICEFANLRIYGPFKHYITAYNQLPGPHASRFSKAHAEHREAPSQ